MSLTLTVTYHLNHKEVSSWFEHMWRAWKSTETPWQMSTLPATSYVKRNRHQWQILIFVFSGERAVKTGLTKGPSCSLVLTVWSEIYTWVPYRRSLCWVLAVPLLILLLLLMPFYSLVRFSLCSGPSPDNTSTLLSLCWGREQIFMWWQVWMCNPGGAGLCVQHECAAGTVSCIQQWEGH